MRVLLVQRSLSPPGGGNAVAAWMVHALAGRHTIDTLTITDWSPEQTNAFYGTAIPPEAGVRRTMPLHWRWLALISNDRLHRLRRATLLRRARQLSADYDLLITGDDFGAFDEPGIQYVNFPEGSPSPTRFPVIVAAYFRFCDWWMGLPWSLATRNLTLANSHWIASRLQGYGETRVLYPPVVETGPGEPWALRSNTFLCIGRFHESKRIEVAIAIVQRLRATTVPDARVVIVGSAVDAAYTHHLMQLAMRECDWIEIREDLPRTELNALMGRSRFGLHAMEGEHFGMATAEMVRAGCLVFPHCSGGSLEVVDGARELLWRSADEAVARVSAVAADSGLRDQLLARLKQHSVRFSSDRFVAEFRAIVEAWPQGHVS